jgi:solute carrier family 30 (zinc transporter), member 9
MEQKNKNQEGKPIIVAVIANSIIAIAKGIGYLFSGSSALLSETIHSIADVMNQSLLLVGIKRGKMPENELFQYGHSQERFFWNLVSAMGIFVLGCGVTLYHGIHDLMDPTPLKPAGMELYIIETILLLSLAVESYSFKVAINEIRSQAELRKKKFFDYLAESTDPSVSAIFWEDLAAILGIMFAFIGIVLTNLTGSKIYDSVATIMIGLLMGWIAYHLAIENKKFLVDRSIPEYEMKIIQQILNSHSSVRHYSDLKTIVFGPDRLKMSVNIEFQADKLLGSNTSSNPAEVINYFLNQQKKEVQSIKGKLQEKIPELKHIDIMTL